MRGKGNAHFTSEAQLTLSTVLTMGLIDTRNDLAYPFHVIGFVTGMLSNYQCDIVPAGDSIARVTL
jgi:hypothetical protein